MKQTKNYFRILKIAVFTFIVSLLLNTKNVNGQAIIHTIQTKSTKDLIEFFKYTTNRFPLVSAHRGGARIGFPENCLATLENTLMFTPAMFEIDPRMTKDSVIILMHDHTLDRTTNGKGKVIDYTWAELQHLRLKDSQGNVTQYPIPLLEDVLKWSKGKTILVLDDKGVPYEMIARMLNKLDCFGNVLMTVRDASIAKKCYKLDERFMFEAYVFDLEDVAEYEAAKIPWSHVMAYIGPRDVPENRILYEEMNERGVKCMISGSRYIDKEYVAGNKEAYKNIYHNGSDIIESDIPIEAAREILPFFPKKTDRARFFGKKEIPFNELVYITTY